MLASKGGACYRRQGSLIERGHHEHFFIQYESLRYEVLETTERQTTELRNKNENPGSENP